jgi:hypothetical protein
MIATLTPEVRARLDVHLDAVERALLTAQHTRERRRGVVDDLEAQILDMLAARSEAPTLTDLEQVLSQLDPPAAYGDATRAAAPVPPVPPPPMASAASRPPASAPAVPVRTRYSRCAIWGLVFILLSMLPVPIVALGAIFWDTQTVELNNPPQTHPPHVSGMPEVEPTAPQHNAQARASKWGVLLGLPLLSAPLALTGTILGWIALAQIRHAGGALRGTGLALFDGLFYPIIALVLSVVTPFFLPLLGLAALATCVAIIYFIAREPARNR